MNQLFNPPVMKNSHRFLIAFVIISYVVLYGFMAMMS